MKRHCCSMLQHTLHPHLVSQAARTDQCAATSHGGEPGRVATEGAEGGFKWQCRRCKLVRLMANDL